MVVILTDGSLSGRTDATVLTRWEVGFCFLTESGGRGDGRCGGAAEGVLRRCRVFLSGDIGVASGLATKHFFTALPRRRIFPA